MPARTIHYSESSWSHIGVLLLGYYTDDGQLHYAGRAGTGMTEKELKRLTSVVAPLGVAKMPFPSRRQETADWLTPEAVAGTQGAPRC